MRLPEIENPRKYQSLYVIDFGDQCGVGYTAEEVATLLESEQFGQAKVYKIYRVQPDGRMELHGVARERLALESGMFFHGYDEESGRGDVRKLLDWSRREPPPCRAKLQLAQSADGRYLVALIYPAEYEQEMGQWLRDSGFRGSGAVDAGISQVGRFYASRFELRQSEQLWPTAALQARSREELRACVGQALQR